MTTDEVVLDIFVARKPGKNSRYWDPKQISLEEFADWVREPIVTDNKEAAPGYVLGTFSGDARKKADLLTRCAITLDADHLTPDDDLRARLAELPFYVLAHTTHSHTEDEPRWRVIIPVSEPMTGEQYAAAASFIMGQIGGDGWDETAVQGERFMYRPSTPDLDSYESYISDDRPIATLKDILPNDDGQLSIDRFLAALEANDRPVQVTKPGVEFLASCPSPAHPNGDQNPSMVVTYDSETRKTMFFCRSCTTDRAEILRLLGLHWNDLVDSESAAEAFANMAAPPVWDDGGTRSHNRIAKRFVQMARGKVLWANGMGWLRWDGQRWAIDSHEVHCYRILDEVIALSWAESRSDKALENDVKGAQTSSGMNGVLSIASRSLFTDHVDSDPWLLNTPSGTLDLHTMELRPHNADDLITKITGAAYRPDALGPTWLSFLGSSLPDSDVRAFLQRYLGQALVGKVIEQKMVIATGKGRNGKGTFVRTVARALGDYAITANNEMLLTSRHGAKKSAGELSSMMRLRGVRWAEMSELNDNARINEALLKSLTGGDVIEAKFMGKDTVEFPPSHSFFLSTNTLPAMDAASDAAWTRIRVVPFDVSFAGREDVTLEDRLALELEAVLAWAVAGYLSYDMLGGLMEPPAVLAADERYRYANDPVRVWAEECCDIVPTAWTSSGELLTSYNAWATDTGEEVFTAKRFSIQVQRITGVSTKVRNTGRGYQGIAIKGDFDSTEDS